MPAKFIFQWLALAVFVTAAIRAIWQLFHQFNAPWFLLLVIAATPMLQIAIGFDAKNSPHHKVKKPITSGIILLAIAGLLLLATPQHQALLLGLLCLGTFLLNTYWAKV